MVGPRWLYALAVCVCVLPASALRSTDFKTVSCKVPGVEEEVRCARYDVYENRGAAKGRRIGLNIVILPATTKDVAPDPLVFLAGGGVAPASRYAGYFSKAFADLRRHRDIVLIDQRGTGGSNALECEIPTDAANPVYRDASRFRDAVRRCRKEMERNADLRFYTTPIAMDDLEDVRRWLGYPQFNLYGVSYGTQAAMVYLRQHPQSVRSIVLHGVVPLDVPMWLDYQRNSQQALEQMFAACANDKGCREAFPHLPDEFRTLLARLADHRVETEVKEPKKVEVPIDAEILRSFVASALFSAGRIRELPLLIHLAFSGNYQPLAQQLADRGDSGIPKGIYYSIVCSEEMHFNPAAVHQAASGTFLGDLRVSRDILACKDWKKGWLPKGYWGPVSSSIPALVLNGALDHVAPPRYGARVARSFSNARQIVLPVRGHNDTDACVASIITAFVEAGDSQNMNTNCLDKTEAQTFALSTDQLASETD